jgi:hypothetical protein
MYEEYNSDVVSVEDAIAKVPIWNAPRVAAMIGEQYFILMEQELCVVDSLSQALFVSFSCYYIYNLQYPPKPQTYFSSFKTTFLVVQILWKDQAHTLRYFLILSNSYVCLEHHN